MYKNGRLLGTEDDTRIEVGSIGNAVRARLYMGDEVLEECRSEAGLALLWAFETLKARTVNSELTAALKLVEGTCLDDLLPESISDFVYLTCLEVYHRRAERTSSRLSSSL